MKTCILKYLVIVLMTAGIQASAQDIRSANLTWSVTQLNDLNTNVTSSSYACNFKTTGEQDISWIQKDNYTSALLVTSVEGAWTNVSVPGEVVYHFTIDEHSGTIKFEKTSGGTFITLELSQGTGTMHHKYLVSGVSITE